MEKIEINQIVLSKNDMDVAEMRKRIKTNGNVTDNIILGALSNK